MQPSTEKSESTLTLPITSVDDPEVGLVWQRGLHSTINSVIPILPAKVWTCISPQFYVTFWQLSLNDIFAPKNLYLSEITKLKTAVDVLERELRMDQRNPDNSKKRKEKDRAQNLIVPLEIEMKEQELHVKIVTERLDREKNAWFSRSKKKWDLFCLVSPTSILLSSV